LPANDARLCGKPGERSKLPHKGPAFVPASGFQGARRDAARVQDLLPGIVRPAFERYGFATAEILSNWRHCAGDEFAACTAPEKLTWPRLAADGDAEAPGATLLLRVSGARALEVQHKLPLLMDRINAAFGYRAIASIRLLQAPLPEKRGTGRETRPLPAPPARCIEAVAAVSDPRLKSALIRLSAGIAARRDHAAESANRTQN
jgi:hypothetical protein